MADFISTYHGPEFEEGLRRILIMNPESIAWTNRGVMTMAEVNKLNELGNWTMCVNGRSTAEPYLVTYNIIIFDRIESGTPVRHRVIWNCDADMKRLFTWTGSVWAENTHEGMAGEIVTVFANSTVPAPGQLAIFDYILVNRPDGDIMLYGHGKDGKTWTPVINSDVMSESTYDPSKRKIPPLKYLEDTYITPDTTTPIMIKTHIPDRIIHASAEERAQWVGAMTQLQLKRFITDMKKLATTQHDAVVEAAGITTTDTNITQATKDLQYHEADQTADGLNPRTTNIHVSAVEHETWNKKAPGDHHHNAADHRVQISAAKVTSGVFSMDRMPEEVKMKVRIVASRDAMLHFTPANTVHRGDVFHILSGTTINEWWRVMDTTKLTILDGYLDFTVKPEALTGDWNAISDHPTTVAGLKTTDLYTKTEVDVKAASSNIASINKAYTDPSGLFIPKLKTIGDASWLIQNYRYPQGYQGTGDTLPGNFQLTEESMIPSIYRIMDRLNEMKYMRSRSTENFINAYTYSSSVIIDRKERSGIQALNPYRMYYPFVSEIKIRNPIHAVHSIYGYGVVLGFDRHFGSIQYTKVNDGVIHYLSLQGLQYAYPENQVDMDGNTVDMTSLIKGTKNSCAYRDAGYVLNIAVLPAIASFNTLTNPFAFSNMDNGGITIVYRAYTWLIPFNDAGILDTSRATTIQHKKVLAGNTSIEGILPQHRLDIEPVYADRFTQIRYDRAYRRYPIGFQIRYILFASKGFYVHAMRIQRPHAQDATNKEYSYIIGSTNPKSCLNLKLDSMTDKVLTSTSTGIYWMRLVVGCVRGLLYGGGNGPLVPEDYDTDISLYCGALALGSTQDKDSVWFSSIFKYDEDNRMQSGSYVPLASNPILSYNQTGFYDIRNVAALYDARTVYRLDENRYKVAMYGKVVVQVNWDANQSYQTMELLMVQNAIYNSHPSIKNSLGGDRLSSDDIRAYNRKENQMFVVPITQLINDFKSRRKNIAVSFPNPNYSITMDMSVNPPKIEVDAGHIVSWHVLDAQLSDIYYFDYVGGRYLMIVGTSYRSSSGKMFTRDSFENRNSVNRALPESEIAFLESYDDCKSFQVVKMLPKYRPEDLLAAKNAYPLSLADDNRTIHTDPQDTGTWNIGANSELAIVVQDEVVYIYNMQDSAQLSNPRIVSLNTFNDREIDEVHETMSPFPYDSAGEHWNPIIKEEGHYRQYLYFEDDSVYYRESPDGISWKVQSEKVRGQVDSAVKYNHEDIPEKLAGGSRGIDMYTMELSLTRAFQYPDARDAATPDTTITMAGDKEGVSSCAPFVREYMVISGHDQWTSGTNKATRINSKLPIYYVYNDSEYRLLVLDAYQEVPVILGYNKKTNAWLHIETKSVSAIDRVPWGLRPGSIISITRHDTTIDTSSTFTYFHITSRDKMSGDGFGPGLLDKSKGVSTRAIAPMTDPRIIDTLVCGSRKVVTGSSEYCTVPETDVTKVTILMPQTNAIQYAEFRQFTRFGLNGIRRASAAVEYYGNAIDMTSYDWKCMPDSLRRFQIHGYNHENSLEIIRGCMSTKIHGFDYNIIVPAHVNVDMSIYQNVENLTYLYTRGFAKAVETWLIARMTATGVTFPATGIVGDISSMYAYSDTEFVTNNLTYTSIATPTIPGKQFVFPLQYRPKSYFLFELANTPDAMNMNGIYRVAVPIPDLFVYPKDDGEGTIHFRWGGLGDPRDLPDHISIEKILPALNASTHYRALIKSHYSRSYSKKKTGVYSLISMISPDPTSTDVQTDTFSAIAEYQTGMIEDGRLSYIGNLNVSTTPIVDEIPAGIGLDLDSYTDPASYRVDKDTYDPAGNLPDRLTRRSVMRASSYRSRHIDQWYGMIPYQFSEVTPANPEIYQYPYNTSYEQTITDPLGYTIFGTNQTVVAKTFLGMYAYLYRFNNAYKNEAMQNLQETEHLIEEAHSILTTGMEVFTN